MQCNGFFGAEIIRSLLCGITEINQLYNCNTRLLHKTQVLSALVIQNDGEIENFKQVAAIIIDDPAILNVLIAPSGVVSDVYPLQGNEAVIGLDFFGEGAGNKEAVMAKETGQLVFGGPFDLVQGGQALVGRLPVWIDMPDGNNAFWGLVSVTLKFPQILDGIGLEGLEKQGLTYKIWRINPDNNEMQMISGSENSYGEHIRFIEIPIQILNAEWIFCLYPVLEWYQRPESWAMIFIGFCISVLFAFVVQNNHELKLMQSELEKMARTDSLTGIFNRSSFMELALIQFKKSARANRNCFVVIFDLDHFKKVNDNYGHQAGDEVLKACVLRTKNTVRSYDVLARYGGEEFIILVTDIDKTDIQNLAERIRQSISETPIEVGGAHISVTASFGIALANMSTDLDTAIGFADTALYKAKEEGRNRVVFYDNIAFRGKPEKLLL